MKSGLMRRNAFAGRTATRAPDLPTVHAGHRHRRPAGRARAKPGGHRRPRARAASCSSSMCASPGAGLLLMSWPSGRTGLIAAGPAATEHKQRMG